MKVEIEHGLPEKICLGEEIAIVMFVRNTNNADVRGIHITSTNLWITDIIEEKETSKALQEGRTFTLESFNKIPRILFENTSLKIFARFKAKTVGKCYLDMQIKYECVDPNTKERSTFVLMVKDLDGASTEVIA